MGEPKWVDHPSWEVVVEEALAAADRDLSHLLLQAPIEELTQTENAQLATTVLSLVVLDAVERIGLHAGRLRRATAWVSTPRWWPAGLSVSTTVFSWSSRGAKPWPVPARTRP